MDAKVDRQKFASYVKSLMPNRPADDALLPFPEPEGATSAPRRRPGKRKTLSSLDLFSGAGGLTIGLELAGFMPSLAVEVDADCCGTFADIFPEVPIRPAGVEGYSFRKFEGIDLVAGGPPCQPFSSGGKGLAAGDRRDMIPQFIRAVDEARPRAFLMENVSALFGATHRAYLEGAIARLRELGYTVSEAVLNAAEYGVPQKRKRGFLVGLRRGRFEFPKPTHGPRGGLPFVSVGAILSPEHALGEANGSQVFYAKTPDLRPSPYDGQLFNGGGRPMNPAATSPTILASAGGNKTHFFDTRDLVPAYHAHLMRGGKPRQGVLPGARRITPEESALLQTFPAMMKFSGSRSSRYAQIGNAVPPLLARAIGRALREQMG